MSDQNNFPNSATEAYHALLRSNLKTNYMGGVRNQDNTIREQSVRTKMLGVLSEFSKAANQPSKVPSENRKLEAFFLGPRGENLDNLKSMIFDGLQSHKQSRLEYLVNDPIHITGSMKVSESYLDSQDEMQSRLQNLLIILKKYTIPFYSPRYAGHMNWDITLPGIVGYFSAMLYNQNNVAFEGAPVTTILELLCAQDLCRMFDFPPFEPFLPDPHSESRIDKKILSWGHLTCDGTIANLEAIWSARNAKFYPLALKRAIGSEDDLKLISKDIKVNTAKMVSPVIVPNNEEVKSDDKKKNFVDCDCWEIMNLPLDEILNLTPQIYNFLREARGQTKNEYKDIADVYSLIMKYSIQKKGLLETYDFMRKEFGNEYPDQSKHPLLMTPRVFVSGSKHYSLPKAVSLLGLGEEDLFNITLTEDARLDIEDLKKKLDECVSRNIPVISVIVVMGTTEESSVDPLDEVLIVRDEYRRKYGLDFNIHADCAYGGYFKSLLVPDQEPQEKPLAYGLRAGLNKFTIKQYGEALKHVDTLTVDPHKTGYIPYACGAFLYRNGMMKNMLLFTGPYLGTRGPNIGTFGVEGSKPGASAASVYLSHQCIPLNINGYGSLLGLTLFNTKIYYIKLLNFESRKRNDNLQFKVTTLPRLPSERKGDTTENDYEMIDTLAQMTNEEIAEMISRDEKYREFFDEIGPDLNILAYNFNFYDPVSKGWNTSLDKMNKFTSEMYKRMSPNIATARIDTPDIPIADMKDTPIMVSSTEVTLENYGQKVLDSFVERTSHYRSSNQVKTDKNVTSVVLLRTVLMDPWTSETKRGDFFKIILEQLDRVCTEVMMERVRWDH